MSFNVAVMNGQKLSHSLMRRLAIMACAVAFVTTISGARALTLVQFSDVRDALSNEIATLSVIENPSKQETKRLQILSRAAGVLTNSATDDGKALRSLLSTLKENQFPDYTPLLNATAEKLRHSYDTNFQFVVGLLPQLPESEHKALAQKQLKMLTPTSTKLIGADRASKVAILLDPARRRLDTLLGTMALALIPPFPQDLSRNTISARVNGINFRVSRDHATDNLFSVTATETNFTIYCSAVDGTMSSETGGRGLILSVPNVLNGLTMYPVPDQAAVTFRTGVYSGTESATNAVSGAVFVSTQGAEIFGVFTANAPGLSITNGRFRLDLPTE